MSIVENIDSVISNLFEWFTNNKSAKLSSSQKGTLEFLLNNIVQGHKTIDDVWLHRKQVITAGVNPLNNLNKSINDLGDMLVNADIQSISKRMSKKRLINLLNSVCVHDVMSEEEQDVFIFNDFQRKHISDIPEQLIALEITDEVVVYHWDWEVVLLEHLSRENMCKAILHAATQEISIIGKRENISHCLAAFSFFQIAISESANMSYSNFLKIMEVDELKLQLPENFKMRFVKSSKYGVVAGIADKAKDRDYIDSVDEKIMTQNYIAISKYIDFFYLAIVNGIKNFEKKEGPLFAFQMGFEMGKGIKFLEKI